MPGDNFFQSNDTRKFDNLIIDVNLWYHRNYHTHKDMGFDRGNRRITTGGIWGFLQTLHRFERDFLASGGHIYFLFDNPESKQDMRQRVIDPYYKANRKKYSDAFYRGLDYLRLILMDYTDSGTVIYGTGFEADDLVPNVIHSIDENETVLMMSEDLDWSRLIEYKGRPIYHYMKKKVFDKREFNNHFNFKPNDNRVILYKTIRGDSVDNIPAGIPNFPTKKLVRLVEDYKDIFDVIDNLEIIPYLTPTWREKIRKNEPRLRLNHQLVSFIPISDDYLQQFTFACKFRPKNLAVLYESLQFTISKIDERVVDYAQPTHHKAQEEPKDSFFRVPKAYRK